MIARRVGTLVCPLLVAAGVLFGAMLGRAPRCSAGSAT